MLNNIKNAINKGDITQLYALALQNPIQFFSKLSYRQLGKKHMDKIYLLFKGINPPGHNFENIVYLHIERQVIGQQLTINDI
jgi:hypothetical protein